MTALVALLERLIAGDVVTSSELSARSRQALSPLLLNRTIEERPSGVGKRLVVLNKPALSAWVAFHHPSGTDAALGVAETHVAALAAKRDTKKGSGLGLELVHAKVLSGHPALVSATQSSGGVTVVLPGGEVALTPSGPLALVEGPALFAGYDWAEEGYAAVICYEGNPSDRVLRWAAAWAQTFPVAFFPDYDYFGLACYGRLKRLLGDRAKLFVPENFDQLLARYGKRALVSDQAGFARSALILGDDAAEHVRWAIERAGMGLEQEALLIDL